MLKNTWNSDSEEKKRKDNIKCIKILVIVKKEIDNSTTKELYLDLKKRNNERYQIVKDSKLLFGH